ncbi:sel-1-like protein [Anaeramoeba flamelloides]|uniref:Sel-1-like protein n=1 Tax=Anaeramoeba flamelloides TaxID=1746091 RepID=A0ABQ8X8Y3_9EUKA|nr:sel-1-like protein [Anaeramoeba flamelloides]
MGCKKDYKKAVEYYKIAVLRGCDDAYLSLSVIYEKGGFGIGIDFKKSFKYLLKSKYSQSPEGCLQIAKIYADGKGVEKNIDSCKEYILKAQKENPYIFIPQELKKIITENGNQNNNLKKKKKQPSIPIKQKNENRGKIARKGTSTSKNESGNESGKESGSQEIECKQSQNYELETKKPIFSSLFALGSIAVVSSICLYNELKSNSKNNKNNLEN